jgi:hypothetical protein
MPLIVAVHGISQQLRGAETLRKDWLPAMKDGLALAGMPRPDDAEFAWAFYGDLFRKPGKKAGGLPPWTAADVDDPWEQELLMAWWREAAREPAVPGPEDKTKLSAPDWVQRALNALSHSRFFAGMGERLMIRDLKQARKYFGDPAVRRQVRDRVAAAIDRQTRVVVGHSLGSVVAYEAVCHSSPEWSVRTFVTLGSPLGIRNLIFDRLDPAPSKGRGSWPRGVTHWYNIAARGDIVALVKELGPLFDTFDRHVQDIPVDNEATAHDAVPYLTAKETGHAIATGLADR